MPADLNSALFESKSFVSATTYRESSRPDTSYEKACGSDRRGSAPATPILGGGRSPLHARNDNASPNEGVGGGGPNTPSQGRIANFFSKRSIKNLPLKRTKSVTKLERSKRGATEGPLSSNQNLESNPNNETSNRSDYPTYQQPSHHLSSTNLHGTGLVNGTTGPDTNCGGAPTRLRSSQSHESLLSSRDHQMMSTLDLAAGEAIIRPLHDSVLGQKYCFQIKAPNGTRYYSCRSELERDKWVESLRRAINPYADSKSRVHNSINITVVEAKGIPPKKQYFCELRLDDDIYGRTSAKTKGELCFWGEQFEFKCLPTVHTATIILWREVTKRRKVIARDVGKVQIPVSSVTGRNVIEKWYPVVPLSAASSKSFNKNFTPSIRIKCSYQTVNILPIDMYRDFHEFLLCNYSGICSLLEPVVSVTTKADVATTLVHLTQHSQLATTLISDIVLEEIAKNDDSHLIFRGNSVGTKAMEAFMKLVGENYLREALEPAITKIITSEHDCEVDPKKVSNEALIPKNRKNLISHVKMTWNRIIQSPLYFPLELRECFRLFRNGLAKLSKEALGDKLISASIFLRFLCPAILNPILFRLTHELPNEKVMRNLTLIAKTLQTLANFTKFQGKEEFMEFMNDFIEKEQSEMKEFLKKISSERDTDNRIHGYRGNIDPGIQLSVLQTLLGECLPNMKPETKDEIRHRDTLKRLIDDLNRSKDNPNNDLVQTLASDEGSGSASNFATASLVDRQKREDKLNQLHGIKDNVFSYNDPTSGSFSSKHSESSCLVDGLERDAKAQITNSDMTDRPGRRKEMVSPKANFSSQKEASATSRSSTLPRSSYLVGSGRTPAMDLHTDDDYVHYSALTSDNDNTMPKVGHAIGHSYSQSHIPPDSPSAASFQQGHRNHHRHFHNHTGLYSSTNNGMNGSLYNSSPFPQMSNSNQNQQQTNQLQTNDSLNSSHDCDQSDSNMKGSQTSISQLSNVVSSGYQSFAYSQSSSPVDPTITDVANNNNNAYNGSPNNNNRLNGNHIHHKSSTSNHTNYQSNRYLNEPISIAQMPQITQVKQPTAQVALAFNNPTYQMDSLATSSPRSNNKIHPKQNLHHHFLVNGSVLPHSGRAYPLSHSQSSHAASYSSSPTSARVGYNGHQCSSSLSSAQSVEDLVCNRVTLSGSDDTSSLVSTTSTPPQSTLEINSRLNYNPNSNGYTVSHTQPAHRIHAHNSYKSSAPRTNPRCLPTPAWQQLQSATTNLHSSINNLSKTENSKNPHMDHHHSTSDLLSTSSYSQPRRSAHKSTRRQSAEFGSARQRLKAANNYDSTSDDTSGDERQLVTGLPQHRIRHNAMGPTPLNRVSVTRGSDNKTLEDYENEIMNMKKMLENLENEVKEQQDPKNPSSSNKSSFSSCNSSNSPPSPAPMLPPGARPVDGRTSLAPSPFRSSGGDLSVAMLRNSFDEDQQPPVTHLAHAEPTEELVRQLLEDQAKKDAVIAAQKEQISTLDVSNKGLLQAYQDLSRRVQMIDLEALDPATAAAVVEASAAAGISIRRGGGNAADGGKYSDPSPHSSDYNGSSC
ncbi:C2 domain [Trinorchestia longiramus]|nr:C2 domain [Trinorchestia longiramus]